MNNINLIFFSLLIMYVICIQFNVHFYKDGYKLFVTTQTPVDKIYKYILENYKDNNLSNNIQMSDLPYDILQNIAIISDNMLSQIKIRYDTDNINYIQEMSEIMISSSTNKSSEKVFFIKHYDGPFIMYPCKIDRIIVAINGSSKTSTIFSNENISLKTYEAMGFDYDRSPHYIIKNNVIEDPIIRIILKLHYYINPNSNNLTNCIQSHINYNRYTRNKMETTKTKLDFTMNIGIITTWLATNIGIISILMIIIYVIYMITQNTIFLILFILLLVLNLIYHLYAFVFWSL